MKTQQKEDIAKIIDNWAEFQLYFKQIPGFSLGIVHKDKLIYNKSFGVRNQESNEQITSTTNYRIASISKLFTTISILQLVERRHCNLDDKVKDHLDWFVKENDETLKNVTIRQLLFHCGGLNRDGNTGHWTGEEFPLKEKVMNHIQEGATTRPTLTQFNYSNLGFCILGQIIEKISNTSFEKYVKNNILEPLNLTNTFVDLNEENVNTLSKGYGRKFPNKKRELLNQLNTKSFAPATGLLSNVEDLSKFLIAQLTNSSILTKESWKEMRRVQWTLNDGTKWGLGYHIWSNKQTVYGHSGGFQGFETCIGYNKDTEFGVISLTNSIDAPAIWMMLTVFKIIQEVSSKTKDESKPSKELDNEYEGNYRSVWGDMSFIIINKKLYAYFPTQPNPVGQLFEFDFEKEDTFLVTKGNEWDYVGEKATFLRDTQGKVIKVKVGPCIYNKFKLK